VGRSMSAIQLGLAAPTNEQIAKYKNDYENWREEIRKKLQHLAEYFSDIDDSTLLHIELINSGGAPATNVIFEIDASGFELDAPDHVDALTGRAETLPFSLPRAPSPPKSMWDGLAEEHGLVRRHFEMPAAEPHDRHKFYWRPDRPDSPTQHWRRESDEFRHQLDPERFSIRLRPIEGSNRGQLKVRVSAANMVQPVSLEAPIRIERVEVSFDTGCEALRTKLHLGSST